MSIVGEVVLLLFMCLLADTCIVEYAIHSCVVVNAGLAMCVVAGENRYERGAVTIEVVCLECIFVVSRSCTVGRRVELDGEEVTTNIGWMLHERMAKWGREGMLSRVHGRFKKKKREVFS